MSDMLWVRDVIEWHVGWRCRLHGRRSGYICLTYEPIPVVIITFFATDPSTYIAALTTAGIVS